MRTKAMREMASVAGSLPRIRTGSGSAASKDVPPGMETRPEALRPAPWRQQPWSVEAQAWDGAVEAVDTLAFDAPAVDALDAEATALPDSRAAADFLGQQAFSEGEATGAVDSSAAPAGATTEGCAVAATVAAPRNQEPSLQQPESWAWTNTAMSRMLRQENQDELRYRFMTPLIYHPRSVTHKYTPPFRHCESGKKRKSRKPGRGNLPHRPNPFNRKLFPSTNTLESPMAAPASTGLKPHPHALRAPAATGIRTAL